MKTMIQLSSGRPLGKLTSGQCALGGALLNLPPHRFDRDNRNHVTDCIAAVDLAPDEVLCLLAEILRTATEKGVLMERPRLGDIKSLVGAAMSMDQDVAELYQRRSRLGSG